MAPRKTVAFICTGNACRSQMAEALLRQHAGERLRVCSAGTRPAGFVHPLALQTLERMGVSTAGLYSKHIEEILEADPDVVITVCDNASAECPVWPGKVVQAHWPMPDPTFHPGTDEERQEFCRQVAQRLLKMVAHLNRLPLEQLDDEALADRLSILAELKA